MDINELESFNLSDAVKFHKELNPRLWQDEKLDKEVRDQLLLIAKDFVEYLGISDLKVKDVTISGSNAAYSYTPHSDLDLHVLVDFNELPNNEVYQELFTAKKTLYNDAHDITVHGVPVELYVQDINQPVQSLGEYSIVHDKWIRIPKKRRANFDEVATKAKYEKLGDLIELALKTQDPKRVADTIALVKRYRKSGLDKHGEFGPENLAYKAVRKQGLVQALYDLKSELHAKKLSIEEAASRDDALIKIKKLLQTAGRTPAEKDNIKRIVAKMMHQWNIDPNEIGVRKPVDPLKGKIAKAAYEKTMAADLFKQEWNRFKKGIFAEDDKLDKPELTIPELAKKHNVSVEEIKSQLNKGITVELEHTSKRDVAREIALDHLAEDPKYYDKLDKAELEEDQLDETAQESQLVNLISKRAAAEIFKMLRKKESTLAKVLGPDMKREKLQYWGISAEKLGVPYVNDPVLGAVLHHAKFIAVDYIDRLRPKRVASYDPNTHEILVHYPAIVRDASDYGYETEQYLAKIIAHELQHAVDDFKSRGKAFDTKKTAYATLPYEINARFQEALMNMTIEFDEARKRGKILKRTDLPKFVDGALEHNIISQYLPKDGKRYKQLAKRAYKFFDAEFNNPKQEKPLSLGKRAINYILGKPTSSINESIAYHVTPTRNLRSIMKNGLRPQIGDRSSQLDGEVEGIFLFPSLSDVEAAVSSWLGDEFDEDEELSLLAVDITGLEDNIVQGADYETIVNTTISPDRIKVDDSLLLEASGYIPSEKEKNDPRFKTALTVDVKPDSIKKNAKAFGFKTSRAGIPPQARADGKIAEDLMKEWNSFLAEDQEQQELFPGYDEKHRQERLNAWLSKSQAVTANYKPKILYHATTKHFDQFRAQNKGFASALGMTFEVDRSGIFLAENPKFAAEYIEDEYGAYKENAVIIPVYLAAQYTFDLTDNGLSPMLNDKALVEEFKEHDIDLRSIYYHVYEDQRWELFDGPEGEEFVANLKKLGYDSAYMYEDSRHLGKNVVWVAFEPSQVKAITNRGSFSPDDPRLMKENG